MWPEELFRRIVRKRKGAPSSGAVVHGTSRTAQSLNQISAVRSKAFSAAADHEICPCGSLESPETGRYSGGYVEG